MRKSLILAALMVATTVSACDKKPPSRGEARPVRTVIVEGSAQGETVSLTGQVRAKDQISLAFRLDGRMIERPVHVGDLLPAGQVVARLDPQNQENALRSAEAALSAARAVLVQTRAAFGRQEELLKGGWTPRAKFDEAQQNFLTAQAQVDTAQAQLRIAQDQLGYTVLRADAPGVVTAVGAEPGEVVRAGQMIVQLAHQGGRDAVFDVPEALIRTGPRDAVVEITLTNDVNVKAIGRVREVAPQATAATRTFEVKVGLIDPPEAMRLGSTVTGSIRLAAPPGVEVPASALTEADGHPSVWVVDRREQTVSLRTVTILRYDAATVVISKGLERGDTVVTAGAQVLRPGQPVRLMEASR
jgi:membrane fusion protein, multidrug efflux system